MYEIFDDLARLLHRLPERPQSVKSARFDREDVEARRENERRAFEKAYPPPIHSEPLLDKLRELSAKKREIDTQIELLVTYSRHFLRPRPYQLVRIAEATGLSISGVRTMSNRKRTREEVARNLERSDIRGSVSPVTKPGLEESLAVLERFAPRANQDIEETRPA
jgi:hypothetical protein|uniref:hypothetical protein n=1 Tax=Nonomuraea sp. CA-252377 TaxID=3240003 RepID=UPI003F490C92